MLLKNVVDDFILNRDKELTLNIMACSYFDAFWIEKKEKDLQMSYIAREMKFEQIFHIYIKIITYTNFRNFRVGDVFKTWFLKS